MHMRTAMVFLLSSADFRSEEDGPLFFSYTFAGPGNYTLLAAVPNNGNNTEARFTITVGGTSETEQATVPEWAWAIVLLLAGIAIGKWVGRSCG